MYLTSLYDQLMPRLPGASEELVLNEVFHTAQLLCNEGHAWVEEVGPLDIRANNRNIYINPLPNDSRVGEILSVRYEPAGEQRRYLTSLAKPPPESTADATAPLHYYMREPGWLVVYPTLTTASADSLYIDCSVIPARSSCSLPETFSTHHSQALVDGTCYRMMMMSAKPWSDRAAAMLHGRAFRNYVHTIRTTVKNRYSQGTVLWQFPAFA